jgi:hypothetical protein
MSRAIDQPQPLRESMAAPARRYTGEVVFIYAFDVAYELRRGPIPQLLGQTVAQFFVDATHRAPRQLFFYRPQMVRMPPLERVGPQGLVRVERTIKILPVGAISITVRVPFSVERLEDLVAYHDLRFTNGSLYDEVWSLAEEAWRELRPYALKAVDRLSDEEAYTVFFITGPLQPADGKSFSAEDWLIAHRRPVASLLTQEPDIEHLSDQEVDESIGRYLSYYQHDLTVIDWDAALVIDDPRNFEETLHIMELANVQLAELEAYDRLLDDVIERSYRDLAGGGFLRRWVRGRGEVLRSLGEIRIDLARLSDELSNITKFFGDWHLARIYQALSGRFHLSEWHKVVDEKLKTLDELYQLLKHDQNNRWMMLLEATIVLLFIVDLILLMRGT